VNTRRVGKGQHMSYQERLETTAEGGQRDGVTHIHTQQGSYIFCELRAFNLRGNVLVKCTVQY